MAIDAGDLRIAVIVAGGDAKKTLREIEQASKGAGEGADEYRKQQKAATASMDRAIKIGAALISTYYGLVVPVRAVTDELLTLQTKMLGVQKTTGLTNIELDQLQSHLLGISLATGQGAASLADIAAIAGQLGIQGVQNIAAFTATVSMADRTMEDLSTEEAASRIAELGNVFEIPIIQSERIGDVLNELSNTTSASARSIVEGVRRIGRSGAEMQASFGDVAGISATLKQLAIDAERGGTAVRNIFIRMQTEGEKVARVMDLTQEEFNTMISEDGMATMLQFLDVLSEIPKVQRAITIQEIFGQENFLAVQSLAGATDLLRENMVRANSAFEEGGSLQREFQIQMQGVEAQINRVKAGLAALVQDNFGGLKGILFDVAKAWADWIQDMRETEFETTIRKLKELGVETQQYELALVKAQEAKAKLATIGLDSQTKLQQKLNSLVDRERNIYQQIADEQQRLIEEGQSETAIRERLQELQSRIALATGDAAKTFQAQTHEERARLSQKLRTLEALREEVDTIERSRELTVADLETVQRYTTLVEQRKALEEAIAQSKRDQTEAGKDQAEQAEEQQEQTAKLFDLEKEIALVRGQMPQHIDLTTAAINALSDEQRAAVQSLQSFTNAWIQAGIHGQNALEQIEAALKSLLAQLAQRSLLYLLLSVFNPAFGAQMGFGQFLLGSFGNITGAQAGGAFRKPTMTMLAEGGETELAIPKQRFEPVLVDWMNRALPKIGGNEKTNRQLLEEIRGLRRDMKRQDITIQQNAEGVFELVEQARKRYIG